jgi:hypothetical protein
LDAETEHVKRWFEIGVYVFHKLPWTDIVLLFFGYILIINIIYGLIISRLICEYYIVPGIEKKTGKILGYSPLLNYFWGGKWLNRDLEISAYILDRYYAFKKYGERGLPAGGNNFALKSVGYTIDMLSKGELIFAFSVRINLYTIGISMIIATFAALIKS